MKKIFILSTIICSITIICKLFLSTNIMFSGFSPIIAIALLSGLYLKHEISFLLPLISLFVSDIVIEILNLLNLFPYHGFYHGQLLNYSLLLLVVFISWVNKNLITISLIGPMFFYLSSNFFVWYLNSFYPNNLTGLITCYIAGIPFMLNSIISTLFFLYGFNLIVNSKKNLSLS